MNQENLRNFYQTELLPSLKIFNRRRFLLLPLMLFQSVIAILIFLFITVNVFNAMIGSKGSEWLIVTSRVFMFFFMVLLAYSILKSYRLFFPRLFNNKRLLFFVILLLSAILLEGVRLMNDTPLIFLHLDLTRKVEFGEFFAMFSEFLLLFTFTLVVLIPLSLLKARLNDRFVSEFKPIVIKKLVEYLSPSSRYFPDKQVPVENLVDSKLFYDLSGTTYLSSDVVEGQFENHDFTFSNFLIQGEHQNGKQTDTVNIFSGILYKTKFNRQFSGVTFIKPDYAENMIGRIGRGLQKMSFDGTKLVQMENPDFEKFFEVRSNDPVEARYILTPSLVERLLEVRKSIDRDIEISFSSSNLYLAVTFERDFISPSYIGAVISYRKIEEYCTYLDLLFHLIEILNLNKR